MNSDFHWELDKVRAEGLEVSIGKRITRGRLLTLSGAKEVADGVSDLPNLQIYSEIEFAGRNGSPPIYTRTAPFISKPQIPIGYSLTGVPLFVGIEGTLEGHGGIHGQTRSGKTTLGAKIAYVTNRQGYFVAYIGMKKLDPMPFASLKAAAAAKTRLDATGNPVSAPFAYYSLSPNVKTMGFNFMAQGGAQIPRWMLNSYMLQALSGSDRRNDPAQEYFRGCALKLLDSVPWGESFRDLSGRVSRLKLDRETHYGSAKVRNDIDAQAVIEQANLPQGHPANLNLAWLIQMRAAVYFDAAYLHAGAVGIPSAALFALALILAQCRVNAGPRPIPILLIIDECQLFLPRELLKRMIELCAGCGIRIVLLCHDLTQLGEDWPTISMAQVRMFFGAVAGTDTALHVEQLFGTQKDFRLGVNDTESRGTASTASESLGPNGRTVGSAKTVNNNSQRGISRTEYDRPRWTVNDMHRVNGDRQRFVVHITPGAEFAHYGDTAIEAVKGENHISYEEVDRLTEDALHNTPNTILPGEEKPIFVAARSSPELQAKRRTWLKVFERAAAQVADAIG